MRSLPFLTQELCHKDIHKLFSKLPVPAQTCKAQV